LQQKSLQVLGPLGQKVKMLLLEELLQQVRAQQMALQARLALKPQMSP
jgi:hypothetical protein